MTHGHVPIQKCAVTDRNIAGRHYSRADDDSFPYRNFVAINNRRGVNEREHREAVRSDLAEHAQPSRRKTRAENNHRRMRPAQLLGQPCVVTGNNDPGRVWNDLPGLDDKPLELDTRGCLAKQLPHFSRQTARTKHDCRCTCQFGHRPSVTV